MKELWKNVKIEGAEEYLISNQGRLKNKHGRILKHYTEPRGARRYALWIDEKRTPYYACRIVALTWLPDAKRKLGQGFLVYHLDGDSSNDCVNNLKLMKRKDGNIFAQEKFKFDIEDYHDEIHALWYEGNQPDIIAEELDIPEYRIRKHLSKHKMRYKKFGSQRWYDEKAEQVRKLYWLGYKKYQIEERLGVHKYMINDALNK